MILNMTTICVMQNFCSQKRKNRSSYFEGVSQASQSGSLTSYSGTTGDTSRIKIVKNLDDIHFFLFRYDVC